MKSTMRLITTEKALKRFLDDLRQRAAGDDNAVSDTVASILKHVREQGDRAVLDYTRRFDRSRAKRISVSAAEVDRAASAADLRTVRALKTAARRIRRFHEMQKERTWSMKEKESVLGQIVRPLRRVGVYVPGGKAAYPSTVLMNVIPAQVAGVREIVLCVPTPDDELNPTVMAAVNILGVTEVYRIGGAQAVAAMAYGTETLKRVDKIVGPGNIYVATAKRMVFGVVDIDMIAGPSEILIIADRSARPKFIAADMLGQAEHDELASSVLVTNSRDVADRTMREIGLQAADLKRRRIAEASLGRYGAAIVTKTLKEAIAIANEIAPEHLEVMTREPFALLPLIENAGAIFLGPWTPEALGDYAAGPNHTLPTGGTARFSSPLGVYDFMKRSSLLGFTMKGFLDLARTVETIADMEGLEAHANSVRRRVAAIGAAGRRPSRK